MGNRCEIREHPCAVCPYRKDVPSGIWASGEYDKLTAYDAPTPLQPMASFSCHATPERLCHGWAVVHSNRGHENDLLALRLLGSPEVPVAAVPLFESGAAAAEHGKRDSENPGESARFVMARLQRKYPRLR